MQTYPTRDLPVDLYYFIFLFLVWRPYKPARSLLTLLNNANYVNTKCNYWKLTGILRRPATADYNDLRQ